jgi:predicted transcriptional regulator of viral defense system
MTQVKPLDFFATHPVFTRTEFGTVRDQAAMRTGTNLLTYYLREGRLVRVRRGLYAVVPRGVDAESFAPDPYLVATRLAPDAAVALHAALQYRGRTYSIWNRFHVATRAKVTAFTFRGSTFVPVRPRARASAPSAGVVEELHAGGTVRVTTFERTLVDLVDAPDVGGGWEEVWRSLEMVEFFDLDSVVAEALARDTAISAVRVGFFLEQHSDTLQVEERHLAPLRARRPKQPTYLDARRSPGHLVASWNLVVPKVVLERRWAEVP